MEISAKENQGPPVGAICGTLFVRVGTDRRRRVSKGQIIIVKL
jgi:hypothetical protein